MSARTRPRSRSRPPARPGPWRVGASPEEFSAAVSTIDEDLKGQVAELQRRRGRIAELAVGEALFLAPDVVTLPERLREIGHGS